MRPWSPGRAETTGALAAALLVAVPQAAHAASNDGLPFAQVIFRATHNSYSGGARGSITHQLDTGVRFVEFDVWSGDHATAGDYRIGHAKAGDQVDHTGGAGVLWYWTGTYTPDAAWYQTLLKDAVT